MEIWNFCCEISLKNHWNFSRLVCGNPGLRTKCTKSCAYFMLYTFLFPLILSSSSDYHNAAAGSEWSYKGPTSDRWMPIPGQTWCQVWVLWVKNIIVVAHRHEGISNHLQVGCLFHSVSILTTKGVSKLQNSGSWSGEWASCQIVKLRVAHVPGMTGIFSPPTLVSDPDMHSTCMTCAAMHAKIAN